MEIFVTIEGPLEVIFTLPSATPDASIQYSTVIAPGDVDGQTVRFEWAFDAGQVVMLALLVGVLIALIALFVQRMRRA